MNEPNNLVIEQVTFNKMMESSMNLYMELSKKPEMTRIESEWYKSFIPYAEAIHSASKDAIETNESA